MEDYYRPCCVINNCKDHSITGRTKLQKIIYFCRELGWDIDYILHQYGTFSFQTTNILKSAIQSKFILQKEDKLPTFKLSNSGFKFLKEYEIERGTDETTEKISKLVKYLDQFEGKDLILASVLNYVQPRFCQVVVCYNTTCSTLN